MIRTMKFLSLLVLDFFWYPVNLIEKWAPDPKGAKNNADPQKLKKIIKSWCSTTLEAGGPPSGTSLTSSSSGAGVMPPQVCSTDSSIVLY